MDDDLKNIFGEFNDNNDIDFNLKYDTNDNIFGPIVIIVRTFFNGDIEKEVMPVALAAYDVMTNPYNGLIYKSAYIDFMGVFDEWGQSG